MEPTNVTADERMFLHTLLSRDRGRAQARSLEPSDRLKNLRSKGLIDLKAEDGKLFIIITAKGLQAQEG